MSSDVIEFIKNTYVKCLESSNDWEIYRTGIYDITKQYLSNKGIKKDAFIEKENFNYVGKINYIIYKNIDNIFDDDSLKINNQYRIKIKS